MFIDIKRDLDNPVVRKLVSESAWNKSTEATDKKVAEFRSKKNWDLYGWIEDDEILGVCGVEAHSDWVEIINIAVGQNIRKRGIGKAMITALQQKYKMTITAETDDNAVEFYQKCGFETEGFIKTYNSIECKRYKCVLNYNL